MFSTETTIFGRASPTNREHGGVLRGGVPPLRRGWKGRSPSSLLGLLRFQGAWKRIPACRRGSKLRSTLTWPSPGVCVSRQAYKSGKISSKTAGSSHSFGFISEMGGSSSMSWVCPGAASHGEKRTSV